MYRVVIVEDDPIITELNRRYAERDGRFTVAGAFARPRRALEWLRRNPADLVILVMRKPADACHRLAPASWPMDAGKIRLPAPKNMPNNMLATRITSRSLSFFMVECLANSGFGLIITRLAGAVKSAFC